MNRLAQLLAVSLGLTLSIDLAPALAHGYQPWVYNGSQCRLRGDAARAGHSKYLGVSQFGFISNKCDADQRGADEAPCPSLPIVCPIDRGARTWQSGIDVVVKFTTRFVTAKLANEFNCQFHNVNAQADGADRTDSSKIADISETEPGEVATFTLFISETNRVNPRLSRGGGGYMLTCNLPPIREGTETKLFHYVVKEYQ